MQDACLTADDDAMDVPLRPLTGPVIFVGFP